MEEQKNEYEVIENRVYEAYSKCYDPYVDSKDNPSDRKVKLWNETTMWCKKLFYKEKNLLYKDEDKKLEKIFNGMGDEIYYAIDACIKEDKMPKERFILYFKSALINAKNLSYQNISIEEEKFVYRDFWKGDIAEVKIMKKIRKLMKKFEEEARRELSEDELVKKFDELKKDELDKKLPVSIPLTEKTLRSHLKFIYKNNGNYISEGMEGHSLTIIERNSDPEMEDIVAKIIIDEFENFLSEHHAKVRDDYKALLTGMLIKQAKNEENEYTKKEKKYTNDINYFQKIESILDSEILEDYRKEGIVREQYEIYIIKHPGKPKNSAAKEASEKSGKLKEFLQKALREKHPEIKFDRWIYK